VAAVVTWPDLLLTRAATLAGLSEEHLTLRLQPSSGSGQRPRPQTLCSVSFSHQQRTCVFVSRERMVGPGQVPPPNMLLLGIPTQLAISLRGHFRVPVLPECRLKMRVLHGGRVLGTAGALDISHAGIQLRFSKQNDPALELDTQLTIQLALDQQEAQLTGSVRKRDETGGGVLYGVMFHNEVNGWPPDPEQRLATLVVSIERFWARHRGN